MDIEIILKQIIQDGIDFGLNPKQVLKVWELGIKEYKLNKESRRKIGERNESSDI